MFAAVNATLGGNGLILKMCSAVHATLIAPPSSRESSISTRNPDMHQTNGGTAGTSA